MVDAGIMWGTLRENGDETAGFDCKLILGNRPPWCVSNEYSFSATAPLRRSSQEIDATRERLVTVVTGANRRLQILPAISDGDYVDTSGIDVTPVIPAADPVDAAGSTRREEAGEIAARLSKIVTSSEEPVPGRSSTPAASSKRILLGPALGKPEEFHSRLGKMLIDRDLVTREELGRALERQAETGERLGEALVALGAVSSTDVARVLAEQLRLPFIDLQSGVSDPELFGLISGSVARRFTALPVARWGDRIVIAMANPNKPGALEELHDIIGAPVMPAVADPIELRVTIERLYGPGQGRVATSTGSIAFTCPGCAEQLTLGAAPWVMQELHRNPGHYYVWDENPAHANPVHACTR
jgi:hypothetical protein